MKKAKEYIIAGGAVEPIRQKYKLTDKQFEELLEVQKKN